MNGLFFACVVLMIVAMSGLTGFVCYVKGRIDERKAWNYHLGLPERTPDRPYVGPQDIGTRPIHHNGSKYVHRSSRLISPSFGNKAE